MGDSFTRYFENNMGFDFDLEYPKIIHELNKYEQKLDSVEHDDLENLTDKFIQFETDTLGRLSTLSNKLCQLLINFEDLNGSNRKLTRIIEQIQAINTKYYEIKRKTLLLEKIDQNNDSKELEYIPETYKHISNRVYLCQYLGIIPILSEHFKHDDNKLLIEFLKDLGIFKKSDKQTTINRAIKEIRANQNKLSSDNFRAILKEYPKLDSNLLK